MAAGNPNGSGITTHRYFSEQPFLDIPNLEMPVRLAIRWTGSDVGPLDASVVDPTVYAEQRPSTQSYVTPQNRVGSSQRPYSACT